MPENRHHPARPCQEIPARPYGHQQVTTCYLKFLPLSREITRTSDGARHGLLDRAQTPQTVFLAFGGALNLLTPRCTMQYIPASPAARSENLRTCNHYNMKAYTRRNQQNELRDPPTEHRTLGVGKSIEQLPDARTPTQ